MSGHATLNGSDLGDYRALMKSANRAASTIALRMSQLWRLAEAFPRRPVRTLTSGDLIEYFAARDWSTATAYSYRATLKDFYGMLAANGAAASNVAAELPRIKVKNRLMLPAPETAVQGRADLDDRTQLMLDLGARQGLRRVEIARIHSRDLVRDDRGWSLVVHGKGDKDRLIPLHDDIAERIHAAGPGWLFPSPRGGHLAATTVGALLTNTLPDGWSAHSLRRRFATQIYNETKDLRAIQQLLGHTSVDTTQRYIGSEPNALRAALNAS